MRRHLLIFGGDFNTGFTGKQDIMEDKGFVSGEDEQERHLTRLGKKLTKTWKRWVTVT